MHCQVKPKPSETKSVAKRPTCLGLERPATLGLVSALCAGILALAFAVPAQAGPPVHVPLPDPLNGFALDKACGAAVDSEGDIYVSSAGTNAIEVFDPEGNHLATVENTNEPCGLAVDTVGNLYATETVTGNVVRYVPDAYPLSGSPTYGVLPTTIDSSGEAKDIAVDPFDNSRYVAKGSAVDLYGADGTFLEIDEQQKLEFIGPGGGTYTLSFKGKKTGPIEYANAKKAEEALEGLSTISAGNVTVAGKGKLAITFVGALAATNVEQLVVNPSELIGTAVVSTHTEGFNGHIGLGDLTEATGVAAYTNNSGDRFVFVADDSSDEVQVFAGDSLGALSLRHTIDGTPQNEVQRARVEATSGTFNLAFEGEVTPAIEFDATHAEVQAALEGLSTIGAGNVAVDAGPGGARDHRITFTGALAGTDLPKLLSSPSGAVTVIQVTQGFEGFGFGSAGASLGVDQSSGHVFLYDDQHSKVDAFEASGQLFAQIDSPDFADAEPTGIAVDRSGGPSDGRVYVSAGASAGAELLAFGAPLSPSRPPLPRLSFAVKSPCGTAVDSYGNIYVAGQKAVSIYDPTSASPGTAIAEIADSEAPCDLAVDSAGNVYAINSNNEASGFWDVVRYTPSSYPPKPGTAYSAPTTIDGDGFSQAIAVNPANDHLFVSKRGASAVHQVAEYDSAANGSGLLDGEIGKGLLGSPEGIDVRGANGNIYVYDRLGRVLKVLDPDGTVVLGTIDGSGSPNGTFQSNGAFLDAIAVDQSNGHVLTTEVDERSEIEEFEASGAFVDASGASPETNASHDIAIDNSGGPNAGNVYVAYIADLFAFGPLTYGEPPIALTGLAGGVGGGAATLNGTVDPRGVDLTDCRFEYTDEADFQGNGFVAATSEPCAESLAAIGSGIGEVEVHADLSGLDPAGRYRFRLVAENGIATDNGDPGLFGPPVLTTKTALPILYTEATVRATVDPSGLSTSYRIEYGTSEAYGLSSVEAELAPGAEPSDVKIPLFGLAEGATYHFRVVIENEAATLEGPDQTFTTLARLQGPVCPNAALRIGPSANLPDCRAYELVTPADTNGYRPAIVGYFFNNWPVTPSGPGAGESVVFHTFGSLAGSSGNGRFDGHRARRGAEGWTSSLFTPSAAQSRIVHRSGVSPDHAYAFLELDGEGSLDPGRYLRTPAGFEPLGQGSLGADLDAQGDYISPGGGHVVFSSDAKLEPNAPPTGTDAVYDRSPGGPTQVVSLLPGDLTPAADASYAGATPDGSTVAFEVGGTLYARRDNAETVKVSDPPNTFAGLSEDGSRIFYTAATFGGAGPPPADLFAFDLGAQSTTQIVSNSRFVNVSADGSRVYFTSTDVLDDATAGTPAADNLYLWDGAAIDFIAVLDPQDLVEFSGSSIVNLVRWTDAVAPPPVTSEGRAQSPTRSTPDGSALVFQSHADLTAFTSEGHYQIYRYEAADGSLLCVSCDPSGAPPTADAQFQDTDFIPIARTTLIPNLTDDGQRVFFETENALLPEDANLSRDVYEWMAEGRGGCTVPGGCLALISSGQSDVDSFLYGMTPDGHDVFFLTLERLLGVDALGSHSIYDARVEGGFPEPPAAAPCEGDACQGQGSDPPSLQGAASAGFAGSGNVVSCAKGARRAKRLAKRAARLRRAAGRTEGVRARRMRRSSRRLAKRAQRLSRSAKRCRANRRNAR